MPSPLHLQRHLGIHHGRLMRKKTTQHCRLLPSVNKVDPSAPTPELREEDAKHGVLNLVTRGFLPAYADLTPAFAGPSGANDGSGGGVMKQRATRIHDRSEQSVRPTPFTQSTGYNLAALKFDLRAPFTPPPPAPESSPPATATTRRRSTRRGSAGHGPSKVTMSFPESARADKSGRSVRQSSLVSAAIAAFTNQSDDLEDNRERFSEQPDEEISDEEQEDDENEKDEEAEMEELGANVDKIRGYNELLDAYSLHQFLIHKGRTMRDTPEFVSFRRVAQELWGSVEEALRALETLLTQYFVPLAYADGQRLLSRFHRPASVLQARAVVLHRERRAGNGGAPSTRTAIQRQRPQAPSCDDNPSLCPDVVNPPPVCEIARERLQRDEDPARMARLQLPRGFESSTARASAGAA